MGNSFSGFGNVGATPTLRRVGNDQRAVADLRVYFDRRVPKGDGKFEDEGGFWLTVSIWGSRGEMVARLVQKGARVYVEGGLRLEQWEDRDTGQLRSEMRLTADSIALDLLGVESVTHRPRRGGGGDTRSFDGGGGSDFDEDDIPF